MPGPGYAQRTISYTFLWMNGHPRHNIHDDECCPDFSCCYPDLFWRDPEKRREVYRKTVGRLEEYRSKGE